MFVRKPLPAVGEPFASSSAWVKVCVAVQVIDGRGREGRARAGEVVVVVVVDQTDTRQRHVAACS